MTELIEDLHKIHDLIETGWTQGQFVENVDGVICYCLDGALAEATDYFKWSKTTSATLVEGDSRGVREDPTQRNRHDRARKALVNALPSIEEPYMSGSIWDFNDYPDRKKQEVLEVVDKAIRNSTEPCS